ncbi:unnamed protein product [Eruca vesicaria subsp. sativa]|uniref:CHHC U11-48K-type domain-containing protein n=1 Tax=Eruca vesicaria subsp. sativa TaxID=29727 RepID=A0ABC8LVM6_ERUVS|nr:unnamed protein product [Eruca vesicaria subsp. sativa]
MSCLRIKSASAYKLGRRRMDRPPSFPNYLNPNPNFFHPPPLQTPNTYSIPPPPPPIRDLSATLSSLHSLLSESQRTLASLSQNLSSLLHKDGFVQCPFDPNHQMPPEALFLHSLHCPNPLDLTPFLESFSSYRNTLELTVKPELNNVGDDGDDDLCFSLDDVTDFGNNFFYNDCPAVVNFSEFNSKTRRFTLPSVILLSVECGEFVGSSVLEILPSDVWVIRSEIGRWRDYPTSYSYNVLCSILGSEEVVMSELMTWILVNSTRYGVIIDTYMRDHVFLLFKLCMRAVVKEAKGFMREYDGDVGGEERCKSRRFVCPVLFRVLAWLASQLGVLYGEGNGKFFALEMLKQCIEVSASRIVLFRSPESSGVVEDLDEDVKIGKALDSGQVISVSRVAAAVAALYERSMLEGKIRAIRYAQPLNRYQRVAELGVMTAKADEERKGRPSYRPIIDHDGLPRQRSSNQDMNKMKTREELLAEERDYKRRRMSYRGKKVKRTPLQVLRDMIEGFTEEVKLAGGIGCFEKGMPLHSSSSIGKDRKESDLGYNSVSTTLTDASPRSYKQRKGEKGIPLHSSSKSRDQKEIDSGYNSVSTTLTDASPRSYKQRKGENSEHPMESRINTDKRKGYEECDSGSSERQQSHRSHKRSDGRDDEFTRTKRHSHEREPYHQNHRSSREKSSSDYKTKRDDRYDSRRSREPRKQNSFEDRYNPLERD